MAERARRAVSCRRRVPPLAALVALACAAALLLQPGLGAGVVAGAATAVVAYAGGARLRAWRSGLAVAVLLALVAVLGDEVVPAAIGTLAPWWIGREVRRRRTVIAELEQRNRELEAEEDAFAALSVRRERARVARELHDIVGHHLAVIVVQAGAGRLAGDQVEHAAERLAGVRESAREALAELACLVDVLDADSDAADGAPGERLAPLLERTRSSGVRLEVTPPGPLTLPPEVEDVAHRVLQEALTNVMKHAPGATVHVRLVRADAALSLRVRNAAGGPVSSLARAGSGLGLAGMRERVAALGGDLWFGPSDGGGWVVQARLPLPQAALPSPEVAHLAPHPAG